VSVFNAVIALPGGLAGLWAARKWRIASAVEADPGWRLPGEDGTYEPMPGVVTQRHIEPVDHAAREDDVLQGTLRALKRSSDLNKAAAQWTGVATLLSAAAAIVAALD
jgi:hypothetical protein